MSEQKVRETMYELVLARHPRNQLIYLEALASDILLRASPKELACTAAVKKLKIALDALPWHTEELLPNPQSYGETLPKVSKMHRRLIALHTVLKIAFLTPEEENVRRVFLGKIPELEAVYGRRLPVFMDLVKQKAFEMPVLIPAPRKKGVVRNDNVSYL